MSKNSALIIFQNELLARSEQWWGQFDVIIAPSILEAEAQKYGRAFENIDDLVDSASVQDQYALVNELSRLTTPDGRRIAKSVTHKGYELWWIHYNALKLKMCQPYIRYRRLLDRAKGFSSVTLYRPPNPTVFRYFLESHNIDYSIAGVRDRKAAPLGILFQSALSALFLPWLVIRRPKILVWTVDELEPGKDYDFRMRFIYEAILAKGLSFVEFIRSIGSCKTITRHAVRRRRAAIYSAALIDIVYRITRLCSRSYGRKFSRTCSLSDDPEHRFQCLMATHYIRNANGTIWAIRTMRCIFKIIGVRAAIFRVTDSRSLHEIIACRLSGIPTIGIQHGIIPRRLMSDIMSGFDGEKPLTTDIFGVWSEWWRQYYAEYSKAYRPEQFFVSGHIRPLRRDRDIAPKKLSAHTEGGGGIRTLFVAEQLTKPEEVSPYLSALLETKEINLYVKFRAYHDGFEEQIRKQNPGLYRRVIDEATILRGDMHDAIAQCEIVVGTMSTGVLESLLQLKPLVYYWTDTWGDYLDMRSMNLETLFAETPHKLIERIIAAKDIPQKELQTLQRRFFGDPTNNGSRWVVEKASEHL